MKYLHTQIRAGFQLATVNLVALAQSPAGDVIPVTVDNFIGAGDDGEASNATNRRPQ